MKRVLLINTNTETKPYPIPPLGLCLLAQCLKNRYKTEIYDGTFDEGRNLEAKLKDFRPDYIGVSIRNIDALLLTKNSFYIEKIREKFLPPLKRLSVPIILGGSGFSIFPGQILDYFDADFGIVGEGEESLPLLLKALDENAPSRGIPGLIGRDPWGENSLTRNSPGPLDLPPSDIDLRINVLPYMKRGSYPVQTKRGCPHACIYCSYPLIEGQSYRMRSPQAIADEIEGIYNRLGDITVEFVDSVFNDPPGYAEAICREVVKKKVKVRLRTMGINPGNLTDELMTLMQEAGFSQIDCTPDSASPAMIKNFRKNFSRKDLERSAEIIKKHHMPTMWFFIFGGPGETEKTIEESFRFIDDYIDKEDMVHATPGVRIFPGTELYKIALETGFLTQDTPILRPVFYIPPHLGKEKLIGILNEKISLRPNCVLAYDSTPSPEMMSQALKIREETGSSEPMFRTLLKIKKAGGAS